MNLEQVKAACWALESRVAPGFYITPMDEMAIVYPGNVIEYWSWVWSRWEQDNFDFPESALTLIEEF